MAAQANETERGTLAGPPARIRLIGQAICWIVLHAAWTWPLLRRFVVAYFDTRAVEWDRFTDAGSADHLAALARAVLEVKSEPERILDIAAGTGEGTLFLAREYPRARVRGIDISDEMVKVAKSKTGLDPEGRIAFKVADASDLPYEENSFDLVTQTNAPVFAAELARVLRPDGYLIVASSRGERTPFHTGHAALARVLRRRGFEVSAQGVAGAGTYLVARRLRCPGE